MRKTTAWEEGGKIPQSHFPRWQEIGNDANAGMMDREGRKGGFSRLWNPGSPGMFWEPPALWDPGNSSGRLEIPGINQDGSSEQQELKFMLRSQLWELP